MSILQTWLQKDSKSWSKRDASFLVDGLLGINRKERNMKRWKTSLYSTGFEKTKPSTVNTSFAHAYCFHTHKLGWTYFSKEEEEFHCRESMTNLLRRNLTDDATIKDPKRMCIIREILNVPYGNGEKDKYAFVEENWYKYVDALLGMCGVSKNIRTDFVGYNPKNRLAVFPVSLALWRSTFFTTPSFLVALMRNSGIFINYELESFYTIPETIEILLQDKKDSWNARNRQNKYYVFGTNSLLWMALLWIDKLREVSDGTKFDSQERYIDGTNSYIAACKVSASKVLRNLSKGDKKEIYTLLGGNKDDNVVFNKLINSYAKEIKNVMTNFPQEVS